MINFILGLFSYDLGIDLGTTNTLVYVEGKGIAIREKTTVARNKKTKEVLALGNAAAKMFGKTAKNIEVVRPLRGGVIADFDGATVLLSSFIKKVHSGSGGRFRIPRPRVIIGIPSGITEVERRAVKEVSKKAGARKVYLVPEVVAAAIGAQGKAKLPSVTSIIDIGGGTTDIAIIVEGVESSGASIRTAGDEMDKLIIDFVKLRYSLLIGEPTAEKTKIALADAKPTRELYYVVRGRDLESGLPRSVRITNHEIHEAIKPSIDKIIEVVKNLLEEASPELSGSVFKSGFVLTGGGALIKNLDTILSEELHIDVRVGDDPLTSVVRGCGRLLLDKELLKKVSYK